MKKGLLGFGLVCVVLGVSGCIMIDTEEVICKPQPTGPRSATIEEIDAVAKLSFDNDRSERYEEIARREGLDEQAQIYLIEAVFDHLSFEHDKVDVLLALVHNPGFTSVAKSFLFDRLDDLSFEHDKRAVLDALDG